MLDTQLRIPSAYARHTIGARIERRVPYSDIKILSPSPYAEEDTKKTKIRNKNPPIGGRDPPHLQGSEDH
jgi:hypothetical protein